MSAGLHALRRGAMPLVVTIACILACAVEPSLAAYPPPLAARGGMVSTDSPEASLAGAAVLARGGNAVDAAVAILFALAATYPQAGNLGGGGFLLVRTPDGMVEAIDFRETAPAAAHRDLFLDAEGQVDASLSTETVLGTGVPGAVAGAALAHERHGTLAWNSLLAPAIRLAEGFVLDRYTANHLAGSRARLERHPETARVLLRDGALYREGDTLRQPELAATLERIAAFGPREFYEGETAALLVGEIARDGGIMTAADLRDYRPRVREPLEGVYKGFEILTMPPPSSGGIALLQMLGMLERIGGARGAAGGGMDERDDGNSGIEEWETGGHGAGVHGAEEKDGGDRFAAAGSARTIHILAAVMQRAFAGRAEFLGDADFTPVPVAGLLESGFIDSLAARIDTSRALASDEVGPGTPRGAAAFYASTRRASGGDPSGDHHREPREGRETTHVSVVDAHGMAVAVTTTLNTSYGNGVMVRGAGFLLNNEMDDFAAAPGSANYYGLIQGEANAVRAGARPLSSMTPVIAVRDGKVALVLGSPGGPTIITSVLQTLRNVLDHDMDVRAATSFPRVHHQWRPDTLYIEPFGAPEEVAAALRARGHSLGSLGFTGSIQAIQVSRDDEGVVLLGASDPRRNGRAAGVSGGEVVHD